VFALDGLESSVWFDESGELLTMKSSIPRLAIMPEKLRPGTLDQLELVGLSEIALAFRSSGTWNVATGRLTLDEYMIELKDAGALSLSMELEGYTLDIHRRVRDAAQKAEKAGSGNAEAEKQAMAEMMAALGEVRLASMKLGFRDGAITRRLLVVQAENMGMTPDELTGQILAMVEQRVAPAGGPQLTAQVKDAVGAFLTDPGALTLSLSPAAPVPVTDIVEKVLNAPDQLAPLLGARLTATANPI
jgi:hypothetical protein